MIVKHHVGIDVSKLDFYACFNEQDPPKKFNNTPAGVRGFMSSLLAKDYHPHTTNIGLESTGPYHYQLSFQCTAKGYTVHIINPLITHAYNNTTVRRTKTDKKDATLIRHVLTQGAGYIRRDKRHPHSQELGKATFLPLGYETQSKEKTDRHDLQRNHYPCTNHQGQSRDIRYLE